MQCTQGCSRRRPGAGYWIWLTAWLVLVGCAVAGTPRPEAGTRSLIQDAEAHFEAHRPDQALALLSQAARQTSDSRKRKRMIKLLSQNGLRLFEAGQYLPAITCFESAADLQQQTGDRKARLRNLNNLARLYTLTADYDLARERLTAVETLSKELDEPSSLAMGLVNLGNLDYNLRRYASAAEHLRQALEIAGDHGDSAIAAEAQWVLGAVYRQQSDFEQALDHYQTALSMARRMGRVDMTAAVQRSVGELYLHRVAGDKADNLVRALDYLEKALATHRRRGDRLGEAMAVSHIGEFHDQQGDHEEAIANYRAARKYFQQVGYPDGIGRMHLHMGFALGKSGRYDEAVASFDAALAVYQPMQDREWIRVALFGKALNLERAGNLEAAEKNYKMAVAVFEDIRSGVAGDEAAQILFTEVNRKVYENLVILLLRKGRVEEALEYVERSRLRSLRDELILSDDAPSPRPREGDFDALARISQENASLLEQLKKSSDVQTRRRIQQRLAESNAALERIRRQLIETYPGVAPTLEILPKTFELSRRADFPAKLAVLTYYVTDEKLFIFVIRKEQKPAVVEVAIKRQVLRQRIVDLLARLGQQRQTPFPRGIRVAPHAVSPDTKAETVLLSQLYTDLVGPVETLLAPMETVALLPFGWLSYLPFGALLHQPPGGPPRFFLEEKHIVYLTAHSYLTALIDPHGHRNVSDIDSIAAFGNPDLADRRFDLLYAEKEVRQIKRLYDGSDLFVREAASKRNFIANWGHHEILHMAVHGVISQGQPELLLAPALSGTLRLRELLELPTNTTTRFVALSACQTAVDPVLQSARERPSEDSPNPSGFGRVALAGAAHMVLMAKIPATLATLWQIDDAATALLMEVFYENLKAGQALYEAFRNAQLSLIQRQDPYSQPYFWAGFVFFGIS